MINSNINKLDIFQLEESIWIIQQDVNVHTYDFNFKQFFDYTRPLEITNSITAIARFGAATDYVNIYNELKNSNIILINNPEQHFLASELPKWYPILENWTSKSVWFSERPSAKKIDGLFSWPIFIKGSRQTSKHNASLAIAHSAKEYNYNWSEKEKQQAINLAQKAANLMTVPFLVIDLAQTKSGEWLIIECNDGQESGYTGVSPFLLWKNIIDFEKER